MEMTTSFLLEEPQLVIISLFLVSGSGEKGAWLVICYQDRKLWIYHFEMETF